MLEGTAVASGVIPGAPLPKARPATGVAAAADTGPQPAKSEVVAQVAPAPPEAAATETAPAPPEAAATETAPAPPEAAATETAPAPPEAAATETAPAPPEAAATETAPAPPEAAATETAPAPPEAAATETAPAPPEAAATETAPAPPEAAATETAPAPPEAAATETAPAPPEAAATETAPAPPEAAATKTAPAPPEAAATETARVATAGAEAPATDTAIAQELAKLTPASGGASAAPEDGPNPFAGEPEKPAELSLDVIDYDDGGNLVLSGRAQPETTVRAFVEEQPLGEATTTEAGDWRLTPSSPVAPGRHALRLEQVGPSGTVVASLNLPFRRAALPGRGAGSGPGRGTTGQQPVAHRPGHLRQRHQVHGDLRRKRDPDSQSEPDLSGPDLHAARIQLNAHPARRGPLSGQHLLELRPEGEQIGGGPADDRGPAQGVGQHESAVAGDALIARDRETAREPVALARDELKKPAAQVRILDRVG